MHKGNLSNALPGNFTSGKTVQVDIEFQVKVHAAGVV
jgi:hypothetical protein